MSRLPFLLLGLIAAGLAASIAAQLEHRPTDTLAAPIRPPVAPPPAVPEPVDRSAGWVATTLARPLFSPDRRPAPPEAAPDAAGGPTEPPRLTGILVTPAGRRAIFASPGPPLVLQEGNRIGSYLVQTIAASEVTILGPAGRRTLRPSYDSRAPGDAAAAPAAELPFDAKPAPSGLDILRNAVRQAPQATGGEPPVAPSPGGAPPSGDPPGIPGVPPIQ